MSTGEKDVTVQIRMLGGFELSVDGSSISDSVGRTHQLWNLLEYLIVNRGKTVSQEELIEVLWPDEESDNPANALKNLIYRVRTAFASAGIPRARDLILYRRGCYCWNTDIPCEVDADRFEALVAEIEEPGMDAMRRIELARAALALYRGDFLPLSSYEKWVVPLSAHYRNLYFRCVYRLCGLYLGQERYGEIVDICNVAGEIDPYEEEAHRYLITALVRQNKPGAALAHYNYVTDLFYRELGVRPSEALRRLYRDIAGTLGSIETDLSIIKEDLCEKSAIEGAFYCDYEVFKNIYRIEARAAARSGQVVFIGLMTVTDAKGDIPERGKLNRVMDELLEIIRASLRKGDVASRFSATQYVVMLPSLTYENGQMVLGRISKRYKAAYRNRGVQIHVSLQPLEPSV